MKKVQCVLKTVEHAYNNCLKIFSLILKNGRPIFEKMFSIYLKNDQYLTKKQLSSTQKVQHEFAKCEEWYIKNKMKTKNKNEENQKKEKKGKNPTKPSQNCLEGL